MIRVIAIASIVVGFLLFNVGTLKRLRELGKTDRKRVEQESLSIVQNVFFRVLKIAGVTVTVNGLENIPRDEAVLYVGNHRSYFDILVGYTTVPTLLGFIAKKEMGRIPLLSNWMEQLNCLFLDRENPKEGLKTILSGIEKVKSGVSIWIFPEGTRSTGPDPLEMLPFKEGSLKIAEKAKCPVIPVALTGTAEIFENHLPMVRPSHVTITFGKPFYVGELEAEEKKFAGAYTRKLIADMLEKEIKTGERESQK